MTLRVSRNLGEWKDCHIRVNNVYANLRNPGTGNVEMIPRANNRIALALFVFEATATTVTSVWLGGPPGIGMEHIGPLEAPNPNLFWSNGWFYTWKDHGEFVNASVWATYDGTVFPGNCMIIESFCANGDIRNFITPPSMG